MQTTELSSVIVVQLPLILMKDLKVSIFASFHQTLELSLFLIIAINGNT